MSAQRAQPDRDYLLVFDGGSLNNPGRGYGSYRISGPDLPARIERLEFGEPITNNAAEYQALIAGLEDLLATLRAAGFSPERARLRIVGDSQLVMNQLLGIWRVRSPALRPLYLRARKLLDRFGEVALSWHPRAHSVAILGH